MATTFISHSHEMQPKPDYNGGLDGQQECKNCWECTCHGAAELTRSCIPVTVPRRIQVPEVKESRWQSVYASVRASKTDRSMLMFHMSYQPDWCKNPIEQNRLVDFEDLIRDELAYESVLEDMIVRIDQILIRLAWRMDSDPNPLKPRYAS